MIGQQFASKGNFTRISILAATFAGLVLGIKWYQNTYVPIYVPDAKLPVAAKVGNVPAAIQQTQALVVALRSNGWDPFKIPMEMKSLPDAKYAENPSTREHPNLAFTYPCINKDKGYPGKDEIALYSSVYVRSDVKYYKGDKAKFTPSGFYIVGWKDGKVTTVPVEDVRVVKYGNQGYYAYVFPGMKEWKANGMRTKFVELAQGYEKMRPEAKAFFKPNSNPECETCKKPKKA